MTPLDFLNIAKTAISHTIPSAQNILDLHIFDHEHGQIIDNGFKLANLIYAKFPILCDDSIFWYGNDTQSDSPIDLKIGNFLFSLKEESYILENMGLYKFLSCITGQPFMRGLHVFKEFAPVEYENWFRYTWSQLIAKGHWSKRYSNYTSSFTVRNNVVEFSYDNISCNIPISISTTNDFTKCSNSKIREKVFAKWINDDLKNDTHYLALKQECSKVAGKNLCKFIHANINPTSLSRLLQIRDFEYFYAKSTNSDCFILKVPSLVEFTDQILVESVNYSVPESQLNIITVLKNRTTAATFKIRNECRFSHGQFNGTPESKMYYEQNGDLSTIYTPI